MRLFEVSVLEPSVTKGLFQHPRRYRIIKCWMRKELPLTLQPVGSEGLWEFIDGYCGNWQGEFKAWVLEEIDKSRYMEADRFYEINEVKNG